MKRIAVIFIVAVFLPSVFLAVLALRTAGEQQSILERQAAELFQKESDALAAQLADTILGRQREFADEVRLMLTTEDPAQLAGNFAPPKSDAGVPFAIEPNGNLVPPFQPDSRTTQYLADNRAFLNSDDSTELFPTSQNAYNSQVVSKISQNSVASVAQQESGSIERRVNPQNKAMAQSEPPPSKVVPRTSDFQSAISDGADGILARFDKDQLGLMLWTRPPEANGYVFGLALSSDDVDRIVKSVFPALVPSLPDALVAVLDENARPIATSDMDFLPEWKRPFVATEIGEMLPHWEVAIYLMSPEAIENSANLFSKTLISLIGLAVTAIFAGGLLVALDARRQLLIARQKSHFVSNVSHELKTPLTSIRMFAELLQRETTDSERRTRYLGIIADESERLTRLINNVLDFAKIENKRYEYQKQHIDLYPILKRVWDTQTEPLRERGFDCEWLADAPPFPVFADSESISRVVINLISNAEKYSNGTRRIVMSVNKRGGNVQVAIADRGIGVKGGEADRIFEAFHRSDDSLASGVQGSGLGLSLARTIARDHGGTVSYEPNPEGGSIFTLVLPLESGEAA